MLIKVKTPHVFKFRKSVDAISTTSRPAAEQDAANQMKALRDLFNHKWNSIIRMNLLRKGTSNNQ